jgi:hypothetical protein
MARVRLATAIQLRSDGYGREATLTRAHLAKAFASEGEPEQACAVANKAVDALEGDVDSKRCVSFVR